MLFHEYTFIVAAGSRAQLASFQSALRIAVQCSGTLGTGGQERVRALILSDSELWVTI